MNTRINLDDPAFVFDISTALTRSPEAIARLAAAVRTNDQATLADIYMTFAPRWRFPLAFSLYLPHRRIMARKIRRLWRLRRY